MMATMRLQAQRVPAQQNRRVPAKGLGRAPLVVRASASGPAGPVGPVPPSGSSDPSVGSSYQSPAYARPTSGGGPGGLSGSGTGGGSGGQRPVGSGGSGGSGGDGGFLPSGWTWDRILLTMLGIGLAIPAWQYLNRRYFYKPEPEHTLTKVEDAAAGAKRKHAAKHAAHSAKHATVDPVVDTGRSIQYKAEEAKDAADVNLHKGGAKVERGVSHAKKDAKHTFDDAKSKAEDFASGAEAKAHEAGVKGERALHRVGDKISDIAYDAEQAVTRSRKGVLKGIKGAAHSVGRKLHVVADNTDKVGDKLEGTSTKDSKTVYYVGGGVLVGTGVLAALYYWDRKGGDIKGKLHKLQDRAKEGLTSAKDSVNNSVRNANGEAQAAAGPKK